MVKFNLESGGGNGTLVGVSPQGELLVRALEYSEPSFNNMDIADTAYNFFKPKAGQRFVITGISADANRNVGANGASTLFYETDSDNSTTPSKILYQFDIAKNTSKVLVGLLTITTIGTYLNGKTDDDDVLATVMGYYVNA